MRKLVTKGVVIGLFASTAIYAAGYKIPEQSLNSVALSAAYVANANGADASYYNPANMVWNSDANLIELDMTYINLPKVDYSDENPFVFISADAKSKREQFLVPTLHFSSKDQGGWRYGISIVTPAGLSKRWDNPVQKATAQEFTLKVIEINPTIAYKINDRFAIGGGFRIVYSSGVVKASNEIASPTYTEDMDGDDISFGYNLAASFRPTKELKFAATYRSKVNLQENGTATGVLLGYYPYDTSATVSIPLPAVFSLATAYTFNKKTTVEFVYERTYWSAYKTLDFDFSDPIVNGTQLAAPIPKNWQNTNTYRIGITHQYNDKLKLMVGFAIDNSPVPSNTLGFELPDADAKLYSCGFEYKYSKHVSFGMAYLYDRKKDRTITESDENEYGIDGTFTHIRAHLLTASLKYRF